MTRCLISFADGAMTVPAEEMPEVAEAAHAVAEEAKGARRPGVRQWDAALAWAASIAVAWRCAQEVRRFVDDQR